MADEPKYDPQERAELIEQIVSVNDGNVPSEMRERYVGPKEASISTARGAIWGAIGAGMGFVIGRMGEPSELTNPKAIKGKNPIVLGWIGGLVGATMGLFSGSREAREGARQVRRMQRRIEDLYRQNDVLVDEVRARNSDDTPSRDEQIAEQKPVANKEVDKQEMQDGGAHLFEDKREVPEKPETRIEGDSVAEHQAVEAELAQAR